MKYFASSHFWRQFDELPPDVRELARKNFRLLRTDPRHPSLHFKKLGKVLSARIGLHYRAIAVETVDGYLWTWIGSHADYDKKLRT